MLRGPLGKDEYRPQFSGHETFPLRYGWLKKAYDAVSKTEGVGSRNVFLDSDAIAQFGVGKNMVASMRHWANVSGILKDRSAEGSIATTPLGTQIFGEKGLDPYMEHPATSWLLHWNIAASTSKTTWFWAFQHFPHPNFEREMLVQGLQNLAEERHWTRASPATIRRDVSCFIRTYVAQPPSTSGGLEDGLECPLTELGLIKATGRRDGFRFVRGPKPSLGSGVFGYAVTKYWMANYAGSATLSFEALAHEPGSPGRTFLLEEDDLVMMLMELEETTKGAYRWSETAGLKQLIKSHELTDEEVLALVTMDYSKRHAGSGAGTDHLMSMWNTFGDM